MSNPGMDTAGAGTDQPVRHGGEALLDLAIPLAANLRWLVLVPALVGALTYGATLLLPQVYTARTSLLPPQQPQSASASALAALGALSGLTGATPRTLADQYAALLQSETIQNALIEHFKLVSVYGVKLRSEARHLLEQNVRVSSGKKDGLIVLEVDDESPERAAEIANRHVDELRRLTAQLALTEAQQRRVFFQNQLEDTRTKLAKAQAAVQATGFTASALRTEPKAAAEGYARLRAELTANELKLQTLRRTLTDSTVEVQQLISVIATLREQLARVETTAKSTDGPDYVSRYREFKYQEALFELFSKQYEASRLDESRDSALIQVVDPATAPEKRSKPKRTVMAISAALLTALLLTGVTLMRHSWRESVDPDRRRQKLTRLRAALRGQPY